MTVHLRFQTYIRTERGHFKVIGKNFVSYENLGAAEATEAVRAGEAEELGLIAGCCTALCP